MKATPPEEFRYKHGMFGGLTGMRGIFHIPYNGATFTVVSNVHPTDKEHISISHAERHPTPEELKHLASMFWEQDEMQDVVRVIFPKVLHPFCVHLDKLKHAVEMGLKFEQL